MRANTYPTELWEIQVSHRSSASVTPPSPHTAQQPQARGAEQDEGGRFGDSPPKEGVATAAVRGVPHNVALGVNSLCGGTDKPGRQVQVQVHGAGGGAAPQQRKRFATRGRADAAAHLLAASNARNKRPVESFRVQVHGRVGRGRGLLADPSQHRCYTDCNDCSPSSSPPPHIAQQPDGADAEEDEGGGFGNHRKPGHVQPAAVGAERDVTGVPRGAHLTAVARDVPRRRQRAIAREQVSFSVGSVGRADSNSCNTSARSLRFKLRPEPDRATES